MRFKDLIESNDYNDDLYSEIVTLLTSVSAEGIDEVDTQSLLIDLEEQGFSIDIETLLELLDTVEIVATANAENIKISTSDVDAMVGDRADDIESNRVDQLATKQATDDIAKDL